ncbi:orotidine-5'-phosphate decarboxylase [Microbacterium sp. TNHR37B]|uniref:orotidine-5'-phosphate decarboxylase n=1 Tax=Microbacterium sp. TNHR37B TaxID=1775956 RepID=UPI0007B17DC1|nr:orotidine-5'-phosphate decarboxylase [Microbacterium sp. TNHR37B]KZE90843.1 Orotidine 5'-phosphate decarboxylase [Microbacterium sp. TNHR37B]
MTGFGEALQRAIDTRGRLCVGIDPHEELLRSWGLDADASGVRTFGLRVVEAAVGRVGIVKPQVAFFERYGSAGIAALEEVMGRARSAGLLVIADAKRGDIGTTMDAYAAAWLTPGAPLEADALTVSPYLGVGALTSTFERAREAGKGVFVLAATSNPEGASLQRAVTPEAGGRSVAAQVAAEVDAMNGSFGGRLGTVGLVIGATVAAEEYGLVTPDEAPRSVASPVLAPGFGAQGARLADIAALFGPRSPYVLASVSRSVLRAGPAGIEEAIDDHVRELEGALDV